MLPLPFGTPSATVLDPPDPDPVLASDTDDPDENGGRLRSDGDGLGGFCRRLRLCASGLS